MEANELLDLPPHVLAAFRRLWDDRSRILLELSGRDAWLTVAVLQFASRNPALTAEQRGVVERVGRALQGAVSHAEPMVAPYLELGWDPAYDRPRASDANEAQKRG